MINRSNLMVGIYKELIMNMIYKRTTRKYIDHFIKSYIVIHNSVKGRSFERTSKTPFTKWYIKRYFKKYAKIELLDPS